MHFKILNSLLQSNEHIVSDCELLAWIIKQQLQYIAINQLSNAEARPCQLAVWILHIITILGLIIMLKLLWLFKPHFTLCQYILHSNNYYFKHLYQSISMHDHEHVDFSIECSVRKYLSVCNSRSAPQCTSVILHVMNSPNLLVLI